MSYALLSDDLLLQLEAAGISREARLFYLEGIVHCATGLSDGHIRVRLTRISDADDPDACAQELLASGVWRKTADGYEIVDYLQHQQSAETVQSKRADARLRAERSRRHNRGDHSICIKGRFCPDGALSPRSRARHKNGAHDVRSPIQSNPILTDRKEGKDWIEEVEGARAYTHAPSQPKKAPNHDAVVEALAQEMNETISRLSRREGLTASGKVFTELELMLPGFLVSNSESELMYRFQVPQEDELWDAIAELNCLSRVKLSGSGGLVMLISDMDPRDAAFAIMQADGAIDDVLRGDIDWRAEYAWDRKEETP